MSRVFEDGGEEAEIAGLYVIGADGLPCRVGLAMGNEFSDHRFEKRNYLNLAGSKIRTCAIGPELVIDPEFQSVPGQVAIERAGKTFWSKEILSGENEMCHSLQNIEHHHFKFETHRRPGDVHVHYFGACALSFGAGMRLRTRCDGDSVRRIRQAVAQSRQTASASGSELRLHCASVVVKAGCSTWVVVPAPSSQVPRAAHPESRRGGACQSETTPDARRRP
jgi:hypothetical protein